MDYTYYAAIDIGSNAVRLLIKRLDDAQKGIFSKVVTLRVPLRLGQDVFTTGKISDRKAHDLREIIKAFVIVMKVYAVKNKNFRACATAAMREATNGTAVVNMIRQSIDVDINIISGNEEATIVCSMHTNRTDTKDLIYIDVGGGSTEVSLVCDGILQATKSYPIGTVRILNGAVAEGVTDELVRDMQLIATEHPKLTIVGAGGNISKLFTLADERDTAGQRISPVALEHIYTELSQLTIAQRTEKFGLKPDRADAIVPAANIFLMIAKALEAESIEVPSTGLADGIIEDLFWQQIENR